LLQGQAAEAQPVVLVRGLEWSAPIAPAMELVRPLEEDLFR
jgi:coenzyme F420-0:L-glutamate ligase/coenzyme F420-1:gamma-L-glutamate ligase